MNMDVRNSRGLASSNELVPDVLLEGPLKTLWVGMTRFLDKNIKGWRHRYIPAGIPRGLLATYAFCPQAKNWGEPFPRRRTGGKHSPRSWEGSRTSLTSRL